MGFRFRIAIWDENHPNDQQENSRFFLHTEVFISHAGDFTSATDEVSEHICVLIQQLQFQAGKKARILSSKCEFRGNSLKIDHQTEGGTI